MNETCVLKEENEKNENDFLLIKIEINKILESRWKGQFQKRKHLTIGKINGNG